MLGGFSRLCILIFILSGKFAFAAPTDAVTTCKEVGTYISTYGRPYSWVQYNSPNVSRRVEIFTRHIGNLNFLITETKRLLALPTVPAPNPQAVKNAVFNNTGDLLRNYRLSQEWIRRFSHFGIFIDALNIVEPRDKNFQFNGEYKGNVASMLLGSVWVKVLSDPRYTKPLLNFVMHVLESTQRGMVVSSDFQTDLLKAFTESGISNPEAEEMAWDILGLYGSQGAFIGEFSASLGAQPVLDNGLGFALKVITNLVSVLDGYRYPESLYSLPLSIKTKCLIGKPYHFWMAAYLSHRLQSEGRSTWTSIQAAYTAGEFYVFYNKNTTGRNVENPTPLFSPQHNSQRLDLSLEAAGAVYGIKEYCRWCSWKIDIDQLLQTSLAASQESKPIDPKLKGWFYDLKRFGGMEKTVAAGAILRRAQGQMFWPK